VDPDQPFNVADFATHARAVLDELATGDGVALLVGGTGLYLRTIARGLDTTALPSDPSIRERLEAELAAGGLVPLVRRLEALAPTRSATIDLRNPRRVVRALEIAELIGDQPLPAPLGYPGPSAWIGLQLAPAEHRRRVEARARSQFATGLLEEARDLRERFDPSLPSFSAIGYREAWAVLDGKLTLDAAVDLDVQRNVRFAKRQSTWFRAEPGIGWLDAAGSSLDAAARTVVASLLER
jgi:tRNA dimethylallyltransferase